MKRVPIIDPITGKRTAYKSKKVYFEFTVYMDPQFKQWNRVAKERFIDHFQRYHASDTYSGNIDFHVKASTWDGNKVYGDGDFLIPSGYLEDTWTKTDLKEVAEDAISNVIKYDLSYQEQKPIKRYTVKITG